MKTTKCISNTFFLPFDLLWFWILSHFQWPFQNRQSRSENNTNNCKYDTKDFTNLFRYKEIYSISHVYSKITNYLLDWNSLPLAIGFHRKDIRFDVAVSTWTHTGSRRNYSIILKSSDGFFFFFSCFNTWS